MSNANAQVLKAAELGMTPREIADDLGYEEEAVKLILAGAGGEKAVAKLFNEDDLAIARDTIRGLAAGAEMEGVRLKAATYIVDEYSGRHNIERSLAQFGKGINIVVVQETMKRTREAIARAKEQRVVELATV